MDAGQPIKVGVDNPTSLTDGKLNKLYVFSSTSLSMHGTRIGKYKKGRNVTIITPMGTKIQ